jgi:hypothetical protein
MKLADVRSKAFAMPLNDPSYPRGPYKFYNREFVVISYRTDSDVLRELVPEPLEVASDVVNYEFILMPDSTGFGDYTETGQVIPVRFRAANGTVEEGGYVHAMYDDEPRADFVRRPAALRRCARRRQRGVDPLLDGILGDYFAGAGMAPSHIFSAFLTWPFHFHEHALTSARSAA